MVTIARPDMVEQVAYTKAEADARFREIFIGTVHEFPFLPAEAWWLPCYGQLLNVADYPALAAKLGSSYGGNGVTTFGVPDKRGRVAAGLDNMGGTSANRLTNQTGGLNGDVLGAVGGSEVHTLTEAQLAAHDHTLTMDAVPPHTHAISRGGGGSGNSVEGGDATSGSIPTTSSGGHTPTGSIANAGGGQAHNNVQPTIVQVFCILAY